MAYNVTGTPNNDLLDQSGNPGPGTIVGLAGDDTLISGTGFASLSGGAGDDQLFLVAAGQTGVADGGTEDDFIASTANIGSMLILGGAGADTIITTSSSNPQTILGGADSSDGPDVIVSGSG